MKKRIKYAIQEAPDIRMMIEEIVPRLPFAYIDVTKVFCMRSVGATARARARIWSFPKIWQLALKSPAYYVIEVLSQHFDHLSYEDQQRVIIHELMHIPKNFSGALVPHRGIHKHIDHRTVETLFREFKKASQKDLDM